MTSKVEQYARLAFVGFGSFNFDCGGKAVVALQSTVERCAGDSAVYGLDVSTLVYSATAAGMNWSHVIAANAAEAFACW